VIDRHAHRARHLAQAQHGDVSLSDSRWASSVGTPEALDSALRSMPFSVRQGAHALAEAER